MLEYTQTANQTTALNNRRASLALVGTVVVTQALAVDNTNSAGSTGTHFAGAQLAIAAATPGSTTAARLTAQPFGPHQNRFPAPRPLPCPYHTAPKQGAKRP